MADSATFERGTGDWEGVIMVERPDISKLSHGDVPMCRVMSARTVQLGGRRAIYTQMPYWHFKDHFRCEDGDVIFLEAEWKADASGGGHLTWYGKARTNLKEWVLYSQTAEQVARATAAAT